MPTKKNYKIDDAVDELSAVRHEICGVLDLIYKTNDRVINNSKELKDEMINKQGIDGLDYATQLDKITDDVKLTNQLIESLLS